MTPSQISEEVERYFPLKVRRVDVVKEKARSLVYKLHAESGNVFLKLWIDVFSRARVAEEAGLLERLGEVGFRAPALVPDRSGGNLLECTIEGVPACGYLTVEIPIERPVLDVADEDQLRGAARQLAEFHRQTTALGTDFSAVRWNRHALIDRNLHTLESLLAGRRGELAAVRSAFQRIEARLARAWPETAPAWGVIHGDCHATNVVVGADGGLWLLDFESFGVGWRIHDVVYLLTGSVRNEEPLDLQPLRERYALFMETYAQSGPAIADVSLLPVDWLAVRLLLQLGRQIRERSARGGEGSPGDRAIDGFLEKAAALAKG